MSPSEYFSVSAHASHGVVSGGHGSPAAAAAPRPNPSPWTRARPGRSPRPTVRRNTSSISRGVRTRTTRRSTPSRGPRGLLRPGACFSCSAPRSELDAAGANPARSPRTPAPHVRAPAHLHPVAQRGVRGDGRAERIDQRGTHTPQRASRRRACTRRRARGRQRWWIRIRAGAVDDDAPDERGDFVFVPHALGSELISASAETEHVLDGVARDAARRAGRLARLSFTLPPRWSPLRTCDAPLYVPDASSSASCMTTAGDEGSSTEPGAGSNSLPGHSTASPCTETRGSRVASLSPRATRTNPRSGGSPP